MTESFTARVAPRIDVDTSAALAALDRVRGQLRTFALRVVSRAPVPLRTGRRISSWPVRSRAEDARLRRVASWKRRRQRRHGVPAASVTRVVYFPNATADGVLRG